MHKTLIQLDRAKKQQDLCTRRRLNDLKIQTMITWHSKRLPLTTRPLLRDGKLLMYDNQDYHKLHVTCGNSQETHVPKLTNRNFAAASGLRNESKGILLQAFISPLPQSPAVFPPSPSPFNACHASYNSWWSKSSSIWRSWVWI